MHKDFYFDEAHLTIFSFVACALWCHIQEPGFCPKGNGKPAEGLMPGTEMV